MLLLLTFFPPHDIIYRKHKRLAIKKDKNMEQHHKTVYEKQTFSQERALYGSQHVHLKGCAFDGEEDGESALKESKDILVEDHFCNLRYPFWHDTRLTIRNTYMTELCRAALWYSDDIVIENSRLHGIKALRECNRVTIDGCDIKSAEFAWSVNGVRMKNTTAEGEYFMLRSADFQFENINFKGKYSFQYAENGTIEDSVLDTKDAFWHAKDLTVRNSTVKGEYLAWYSENLTLVNCKIIGTQPFCYCKNLRLVDCEMHDADLAFEKSEVDATVTTPVVSIKNPTSGRITVPAVAQLILTDENAKAEIVVGNT